MAHTEPGDLSRPTPLLGDLLVNEGVLTRAELDKALDMQAREGGFLGQVLVQMGFVKQSDVSSCLVKQCKVPHLSLLDYNQVVPWAAAQTAGADASGAQCGSFGPGLPIPVIELQSILTP